MPCQGNANAGAPDPALLNFLFNRIIVSGGRENSTLNSDVPRALSPARHLNRVREAGSPRSHESPCHMSN